MENREQIQTNQMGHNVARTPCADISSTINTGKALYMRVD